MMGANLYFFSVRKARNDRNNFVKYSTLASLLRNRRIEGNIKERETANGVSQRKLATSEFSLVLSQFRFSFIDVFAFARSL